MLSGDLRSSAPTPSFYRGGNSPGRRLNRPNGSGLLLSRAGLERGLLTGNQNVLLKSPLPLIRIKDVLETLHTESLTYLEK